MTVVVVVLDDLDHDLSSLWCGVSERKAEEDDDDDERDGCERVWIGGQNVKVFGGRFLGGGIDVTIFGQFDLAEN